jgi:tetratricopeptide (TPR) repeat protein
LAQLDQTKTIGESAGLTRLLADVYARAAKIYQKSGDFKKAERSAELAAENTQLSGDIWAVPQRLQELAELQVSRGRYAEADRAYDRAETFLDAMIGNVSGARRGRLLAAGAVTPLAAKRTERANSQLRLKLMAARSTDEVRSLRDEIFMTEQTRWVNPVDEAEHRSASVNGSPNLCFEILSFGFDLRRGLNA